jgi:hypothetical protein
VRPVAPLIVLAAALALLASGCGGSKSAEEQFADSVCTSVGEWQDAVDSSVNSVRAQINSPSTGMVASINEEIQSAVDATKKLTSDLKSLDPPKTDDGKQAKQQLLSLNTQLEQTVMKTKTTVAGISDSAGVSEIVQTLATLVPSLQALATSASNTISSIRASSEKLKDGFDKAKSCKQFR